MGAGKVGTISSVAGGAGVADSDSGCRIGGLNESAGAARFDFVAIRPRAFSAIADPTATRANSVQAATHNLRRRAAPQRSSVVMPKGKYRVATISPDA